MNLTASRQSSVIAQLPVLVTISGSGVFAIAAGYRAGVTPPTWLTIHLASGSVNSGQLSFNFVCLPGSLANGTYHTTVTITSRDVSGNDLAARDVDVSYTVRDGVGFSPSIFKNLTLTEGSPEAQQDFPVNVLAGSSATFAPGNAVSSRGSTAWARPCAAWPMRHEPGRTREHAASQSAAP